MAFKKLTVKNNYGIHTFFVGNEQLTINDDNTIKVRFPDGYEFASSLFWENQRFPEEKGNFVTCKVPFFNVMCHGVEFKVYLHNWGNSPLKFELQRPEKPDNISKEDWEATPKAVKDLILKNNV